MSGYRGRHAAPPTALAAFKDARDAAQLACQREMASAYDNYCGMLANAADLRREREQSARDKCEAAIAAARAKLDAATGPSWDHTDAGA